MALRGMALPLVNGRSVVLNQICSRFLECLYPQVHQPLPLWDLNLVLPKLMGPPFELMVTCSWKVVVLVAIALARRVSEIQAIMSEPPYTVFKNKVSLRPHRSFLPKVVSPFHKTRDIFLPVFHRKPHTSRKDQRLHSLDVRQTLVFYIERIRPFWKTTQLFVTIAERMRGEPVSTHGSRPAFETATAW